MIEDNLPSLTAELNKSKEKLKKLRNLRAEIGSKYIAEDAWRRYLEDRIHKLEQVEVTSNLINTVANATQEV